MPQPPNIRRAYAAKLLEAFEDEIDELAALRSFPCVALTPTTGRRAPPSMRRGRRAPAPAGAVNQTRPHPGKHLLEHRGREPSGVQVVARAVVGRRERRAARERRRRPVHEGMRRAAEAERAQDRACAMAPSGSTAWARAAAQLAEQERRQALTSSPSGRFSGGTQRTALVIRQSTSSRPSSGAAR